MDLLAARPELHGRLVVVDDDPGPSRCARINWAQLRDWALSDEAPPVGSSAVRVLGAACSLAGNTPVQLRDLAADGLGKATKRAVLTAITAAFGDVADDPVWDPETM